MKYISKVALVCAAVLLFVAVYHTFAQTETAESQKPSLEIIPNEIEPTTSYGNMSVNSQTGVPVALYQVNAPVAAGTPEQMAREYLRTHADLLHLQDPTLSDLVHRVTRESLSGYTVRFTQQVAGVPVYHGEIAVHIHGNIVTYVSNQYQPAAAQANTTAVLSETNAHQIAFDHLNAQGNVRLDKTQLVVYLNQGITRLVYQVRIIPASPVGDWELLVDAQTGELLKVVNLAYNLDDAEGVGEEETAVLVDGTGLVFDPDPLSSSGAAYGDPGFSDGGDVTTPEMDAERVSVTLFDIQFSGGMYTLIGPYAEIQDFEAPNYGLFPQATDTFNYNRFDNNFEAVMTYYHIDGSMRYINETLNIPLMPSWGSYSPRTSDL